MINDTYKYSDLTSKIIGCAMTVHSTIGSGFPEVIYQRAMEVEMERLEIPFKREYAMPVFYRDVLIGSRRVDFLAYEKITVELKAVKCLEDLHFAQAINYLEAFNLEIGLLLNFGSRSLDYKRLTNKKFKLLSE